jgi:signal transduction histidine kinase
MVRYRPRWGRAAAPVVALFIVTTSIVIAFISAGTSERQERQLLTERAGELAAVLTLSAAESRSVLQVAGATGSSAAGALTFGAVTARTVAAGSTVTVVRRQGAGYAVLRSAGTRAPPAGSVLDPAVAGVVGRAATAVDLVSGVVGSGSTRHVVLALAAPGAPDRIAYLDSPLAPARSTPSDAGSPYRELDVALYAGKVADPRQLVLTSGSLPGRDGPVVSKQFQVGVDTWSLTVSAREPLIGSLATAFPWLLGGAGLLTATVVGLLIGTLQRRREYALGLVREAQDEAEEANRAREAFFASVSHDIRTPLTAIMGFTEMISSAEPEEQDEFVQRVRSNVATLGVMVDNMLDHARIKAGALDVALEPLCLKGEVERCLEDLGPVLTSHEIAVHGTAVTVLADRHALRRVLANVLINAVRYSPAGTQIEIDLSADQRSGRVAVIDHGRGIDEQDLESIFDEFSRGSRAKVDGGTGLGLYSVHQLVEVLHGAVGITSTPGAGTTVTVELPRAA